MTNDTVVRSNSQGVPGSQAYQVVSSTDLEHMIGTEITGSWQNTPVLMR